MGNDAERFEPKTAFGKKLWAKRQAIIKAGYPALSLDEICP